MQEKPGEAEWSEEIWTEVREREFKEGEGGRSGVRNKRVQEKSRV